MTKKYRNKNNQVWYDAELDKLMFVSIQLTKLVFILKKGSKNHPCIYLGEL